MKLSRRVALFVALALPSVLGACATASSIRADRVVVVGAGMSGLTAAQALAANGIDVVVLEARDRIGGRTHTAEVDGATLDLGGAWIHGPGGGNPLSRLANGVGAAHVPHDYDFVSVVDTRLGELDDATLETLYARAESATASVPRGAGNGDSVSDAVTEWLDGRGYSADEARLVRFGVEQGVVALDYSGPASNTSARWLGYEEEYPGGDALVVGGYRELIEPLANGLDIQLSSVVETIRQDDMGVEVITRDGRRFTGSHAIVTVPLGVLQARIITFDPPLPDERLAAIDRLDMGSLEKVVLRFDSVFWSDFIDQAGLLIDADEPGRFPAFVDFTRFTGVPTLVCLYGGAFSRTAQDTMDDAQIVAGALAQLERLTGVTPPAPRATHVTRWRSDPFSRGSYSYIPVGAQPSDMRELARPVGRVGFAGEATYFDYLGTVHGAMLSGLREAERVGGDRGTLPGF